MERLPPFGKGRILRRRQAGGRPGDATADGFEGATTASLGGFDGWRRGLDGSTFSGP